MRRFIVKVIASQQRLGENLQGGVFRCSCGATSVPGVLLLYIEGGFAREELLVLHDGELLTMGTSLSAHGEFKNGRSHAMVRSALLVHQQGWDEGRMQPSASLIKQKQAFQGLEPDA